MLKQGSGRKALRLEQVLRLEQALWVEQAFRPASTATRNRASASEVPLPKAAAKLQFRPSPFIPLESEPVNALAGNFKSCRQFRSVHKHRAEMPSHAYVTAHQPK